MDRRVRVGLICVLLATSACERDHATGIGDASEEGLRYTLLRDWARVVNEGLAAHANGLFSTVLDARLAESQRLEGSSG